MKLLSLSLLAAVATTASAQSPWRFSAGYSPMIGLRTEFSGFGNFNNPFPALPAPGPASNYFYLDGSVQVDSSGNAGGQTSFFSYQADAQYDPTAFGGSGAINFNALAGGLNSAGTASESNIAAAGGFDLSAYLHLGSVAIPSAGGRSASWGLRMGAQYTRVDVDNNDSMMANVGTITDSFSTNGLVPPLAPYAGPFNGVGFLLGSTPTRTFGNANAVISGSRELDVHILATQFGTYLEIPVAEKLDVMLEGGFILGLATGSYRYDTSVTVPGAGTQTSDGYASKTKFLPGFYTGVSLIYHLTQNLGIQTGARYQFMKEFEINANGSTASLSFDTAFALSLGVLYTF